MPTRKEIDERVLIVYMCGVDWRHEAYAIPAMIYPSEKSLRRSRECVSQCGIVEIEMRFKRWVQPEDFGGLKVSAPETVDRGNDRGSGD